MSFRTSRSAMSDAASSAFMLTKIRKNYQKIVNFHLKNV